MMKNAYWVACFALLSIAACKNEKTHVAPIVGHWNLTYGEMNGREAPSLEKIYFEFGIDSVKTNFTVSETEEFVTFDMTDQKITQNSVDPIEYNIESLTDTTLELSTALRGLEFKLVLKKAAY
jgi:hypothetical protein